MEVKITNKLFNLFEQVKIVKKVTKGETLKRSGFKEVLNWYKSEIPWSLVTPDLILAFEDYSKKPDEALLIAIEVKYFTSDSKKQWRQNFREIGQPLRNLIFGFNSVVLWHLFSEHTSDENIKRFSNICGEVIDWLKLPMVYLVTKIDEEKFRIYKPWDLDDYKDIDYMARSLQSLTDGKRSPITEISEVIKRRKAIKSSLNIP